MKYLFTQARAEGDRCLGGTRKRTSRLKYGALVPSKGHMLGVVLPLALCLCFLGHVSASPRSPAPQRIISLVPAATEELYLLGVEDRLVGVTIYCQRPSGAQTKEKVGAVIQVNVEKILELSPDLVIASNLTDQRALAKLRALGIRIEVFTQFKDFEGLCKNFLKLARLVGKEQEAITIVSGARRELKTQTEDLKALPFVRVFVQIGAHPLFTAGRATIIDEMIKWAGGRNIAHNIEGWSIYSREEVIRNNPDIILVATMGTVREKERETWLRYDSMKAVKNKRIYVVDAYPVCSPTPLSFVKMVGQLVRFFHGK